jgi:hypothetical protein
MMTLEPQQEMETCIQDCLVCQRACFVAAMCYLQQAEGHAEVELVQSLLTCANICQTTADLMLLSAKAHPYACAACAELCEQCAQKCEQKAANADMKACAKACCRCAESCYYLAGLGGLNIPTARMGEATGEPGRQRHYDKVDQASAQSFPASDPPGYLSDE